MKLQDFLLSASTLPPHFLEIEIQDLKIRDYMGKPLVINKNHKPMIYSDGKWRELTASDWQ